MMFILHIKHIRHFGICKWNNRKVCATKSNSLLTHDVRVALDSITLKTSFIEIWRYTDLSELPKDKVYSAFKELKERTSAYSISYCRTS